MTATAAPPHQIVEIPIEDLHPADDNPRLDVGDVTELAESIKAHGVLQALVVAPRVGKPGNLIVAGHRRHAAAKLAGLTTVPCVVRHDLDDQARREIMLVENLQRADLTAVEEAFGYQKLIDLHGYSQRKLAERVGVNQSHISKRIKLLKLPTSIRDEVDAGSITVDDALQLAKLVDHGGAAAMKRARKNVTSWRTLAQAVQSELEQWNANQRIAKRKAVLEEQGIAVVAHTDVADWFDAGRKNHKPVVLKQLGHYRAVPDDHDKLPCHAVRITPWKLDHDDPTDPVCTDPHSHAANDPDAEADKAKRLAEQEARSTAIADASKRRAALIADLIRQFDDGTLDLEAPELLEHVLLQLIADRVHYNEVERAHEILGLPEPSGERLYSVSDADLMAYAASGPVELVRATLAIVLVDADYSDGLWELERESKARRHLTFLQGRGYQPSTYELATAARGAGTEEQA